MFLGLFSIPGIGTVWLSYVLPISCFAVIPLFLTVKEEYNRLIKQGHGRTDKTLHCVILSS